MRLLIIFLPLFDPKFFQRRSVSDAIYSKVPGAQLTNVSNLGEIYTLPCKAEVNVTFVFSGTKYPIHPLDTNMNGTDLGITDGTGTDICIGAVSINLIMCNSTVPNNRMSQFQPVSFDSSFGSGTAPLFDMILGMGFCKYILCGQRAYL